MTNDPEDASLLPNCTLAQALAYGPGCRERPPAITLRRSGASSLRHDMTSLGRVPRHRRPRAVPWAGVHPGEHEMPNDFEVRPDEGRVQVIAFYLPQFHPIPENDLWWEPGFTEWTNVTRARRMFPGHYQPRLPGELGFYDLRLPETREAQAKLAAQYGVSAFCYWHYWFGGGRRLLERPFDEVLQSGSPDFPFCLGWANQTWSGIWHGAPSRILIEQTYPDTPGEDDYRAHFEAVLPAFMDPRYLAHRWATTVSRVRPHRSARATTLSRSVAQLGR